MEQVEMTTTEQVSLRADPATAEPVELAEIVLEEVPAFALARMQYCGD